MIIGDSLVAQIKNLPAMKETWVRSLSQEDPLEKGMATQGFTWFKVSQVSLCFQGEASKYELGTQSHSFYCAMPFFPLSKDHAVY